MASAHILLHQIITDDAMKALKRYNEEEVGTMAAAWRLRMILARGQVYAARGREV